MAPRFVAVIACLAVCLLCCTVAEACPTCKDALVQDGNAANLVRGYFWSIIFMMSMPFLILAGMSSYFYYEIRRARLHVKPALAA